MLLKMMETKKESEPMEIIYVNPPTKEKEREKQIGLCLYCGKRGHLQAAKIAQSVIPPLITF